MKIYVAISCRVISLLGLLAVGGNCTRITETADRPHKHHKHHKHHEESRAPVTVIYHNKSLLKAVAQDSHNISTEVHNNHSRGVIRHAKVHHESKASVVAREVVDVTHFLTAIEKEKVEKKPMPPFDEWLPKCIRHVKALVLDLDRSYTDQQLKYALETDCELDKQFTVYEDGFHNKSACTKFAELLVIAREADLKYDTDEGYKGFCSDYYLHKGGDVPEEKEKVEAEIKEEGGTALTKGGKGSGNKGKGKKGPATPFKLIMGVILLQVIASAVIWYGCQLRKQGVA